MIALLFTLGLGFLGMQADAYRAATQVSAANEAMECAMAGLEDVRVKLMMDSDFPPPGDDGQMQFGYAEVLHDLDGTTAVGSYSVLIDRTWEAPPFEILRVQVIGLAGDPASSKGARSRRILSVEVDMAETLRNSGSGPDLPNPNVGRFINFRDHGSL